MGFLRYLRSLLGSEQVTKEPIVSVSPPADTIATVPIEAPNLPPEPMLTVSQAANKKGVTRQAIFFAIRMKRLNATKDKSAQWRIYEKDLEEYCQKKYCRSKTIKHGELVFDKKKGFYSILEVSKILGKPTQHVYYLVRLGRLKSHRQGGSIVIQDKDLYAYRELLVIPNQTMQTV